jgi:cytoskeleton protein RodZ
MPDQPVTAFGVRLQQAREARGVSLAHVATVTKISVRALEAVERNDYSRLPGGIFTRSFVRAYAAEVGLDPDVAVRAFLAQCPADIAAVPTDSPDAIDGPTTERWHHRFPWRRIAAFVLLVLIAAAGGYTFAQRLWAPATGSETRIGPAADRSVVVPAADPAVARGTDAPPEGPVMTAGTETTGLTILLAPSASCQVSIGVDGRRASSHRFLAGEHATIRAEREVLVTIGDAAAMTVTINGQRARLLGRAGEVVTARIAPETLQYYLPSR